MSIVPIIQQAILAGFGEEKILNFIAKRLPQLAKGIQNAKDSGFDPAKILRFVAYNAPSKSKKNLEQQESANDRYLSNVGLKTKAQREQQQMNLLKGALGVGAGVLGLAGSLMPKAGPAPLAGAPGPSPIGPKPMANAPVQPAQLSPQATARAASAQTLNAVTPEFQQYANQQLAQGIEKPLAVQLREFQEMKAQESAAQAATPQMQQPQPMQMQAPRQPSPLQQKLEEGLAKMGEPLPVQTEEKKAPQKGTYVATPDGKIGQLESIREKEALVKDDVGKLHKVKADEIIESPLPEKDLAQLHDDLLRGIEKETGEDVSRMVNFAGYDANKNELAFLPHTGALYIYKNISPEDAEFLTNIQNVRKTSGENFIGAWREGTKSPIGAALSALIRKLQAERGGKGSEYEGKYETLYSALEPAHLAKKKKMKHNKKNVKPIT